MRVGFPLQQTLAMTAVGQEKRVDTIGCLFSVLYEESEEEQNVPQ